MGCCRRKTSGCRLAWVAGQGIACWLRAENIEMTGHRHNATRLLQTSPEISRGLLRQMALSIEDLYGKLALHSSRQKVS